MANSTAIDFFLPNNIINFCDFIIFGVTCCVVSMCNVFITSRTQYIQPDVVEPYAKKYYEEFRELEMIELLEQQKIDLGMKFMQENTPSGHVTMTYNHSQESFNYWCDDKNIPFLVLDAVAHKFAITYNCRSICVDYKDECDKALINSKQPTPENIVADAVPISDKNALFVSYKNYKTVDNLKTDKKKYIIPGKCNRYRRCGDSKDLTMGTSDLDTPSIDYVNITWNEYISKNK